MHIRKIFSDFIVLYRVDGMLKDNKSNFLKKNIVLMKFVKEIFNLFPKFPIEDGFLNKTNIQFTHTIIYK